MSQEKTKTGGTGTPLRERTESDIRHALERFEPGVVEAAVRLHAYAVKNGLGVSSLGHQTRIAGGILSQWLSGNYPGDASAIAERVGKFLWSLEQKQKYGGLRGYVKTRIAEALSALFEKTRVIRRIQTVRSPEQVGKTTVARRYQEENNHGRTVYIAMPGGARSGFGDFLWVLADALEIPYTIKLREKRIRIRHALEACDLVIIDEAHLIWEWTNADIRLFLDFLRTDLHQDGERGVILLETNSDFVVRLQRFKRVGGYNVGQLLGRMRNEAVEIDPAEDIVESDVRALVGRYYHPGAATLKKLHTIATRERLGHFGLVLDIVNEAWSECQAAGCDLGDAAVEAVAQRILSKLAKHEDLYK